MTASDNSSTAASSPRKSQRRQWQLQSHLPTSVSLIQELAQPKLEVGSISGFRLALPNCEDTPAGSVQREFVGGIALNVAGNLGPPVCSVRFRLSRAPNTVMSMPEATVDKDNLTSRAKDKVWLAGEVLAVEPVPVAMA